MICPRCVCVLHIKPLFLPVDIQHTHCACRFFGPREVQALCSQKYATEMIHCDVVSRVDKAMPYKRAEYGSHGIHILSERKLNK